MIYPTFQPLRDQNPPRSRRWTLNFTTRFLGIGRTAATVSIAPSPRPRHHPTLNSGRLISPWWLKIFLLHHQTAVYCLHLDPHPTIYHHCNRLRRTPIPVHIPSRLASLPSLSVRNLLLFPQALHEKAPFHQPMSLILRHHQVLPEARSPLVSVPRVNRAPPFPRLSTPLPRPKVTASLSLPPLPPVPSSTPRRSLNPSKPVNLEKASELLKSSINPASSTV